MGFYPVCPGTPVYVVGEPLFQRITINNPEGEPFIIDRVDIEKLPLTITHDEIVKGGRLGGKEEILLILVNFGAARIKM